MRLEQSSHGFLYRAYHIIGPFRVRFVALVRWCARYVIQGQTDIDY